MARRLRLKLVAAILASVFFCGVVVPPILLALSPRLEYVGEADGLLLGSVKTARRALADYRGKFSRDELQGQVEEMETIKLSVRNELRLLQSERIRVLQETEKQKLALEEVQKSVESAKKELLLAKSGLTRVSHEVYLAQQEGKAQHKPHPPGPPPIVILPPSHHSPSITDNNHIQSLSRQQCSYARCIDFTSCPLTKPFKVYVYGAEHQHHAFSDLTLVDDYKNVLRSTDSLALTSKEACAFVVLLGRLDPIVKVQPMHIENLLYSLPYWNNDGCNHYIISLSRQYLHHVDIKNAISVRSWFSQSSSYRPGYDILLPVPPLTAHHGWKGFPPQVPALRNHVVYFNGQLQVAGGVDGGVTKKQLDQLAVGLGKHEAVQIVTDCDQDEATRKNSIGGGEWMLCGSASSRADSLSQATFTLIPSGSNSSSPATYQRLSEALYFGAIPVIIGVSPLPFELVIDWSAAAIILPLGRFHELHLLIRSLPTDKILEMRRQGRFLWETYFSSTANILRAMTAIVRYIMLHPPPPAPDFKPRLLHKVPGTASTIESPSYVQNFSYYSHSVWNTPPGPYHMYPNTPWSSSPVSGSEFASMSSDQLKVLPPHIVLATGITGPYFENYLLGNSPEEHFTVVMLTYKRNDVLIESLERLNGLSFLAKVVVVWNNPEDIPINMEWPKISAPIEVVCASFNSLNNRFLPLENVKTEAILSIDDDVYLRHDEIQFAFRVWRESRDRLVGFPGRFHAYDIRHRNWLYNANHTCELSMVLTGAAFFHKYYSYMYTQWMSAEIREMVDHYINCEDIAMNFLVSHITRKPPLKVTSRWTFRCPGCPDTLSQSDEHFTERHHCINQLRAMYGYMPLLYTQFRLDSVLFKTRLPSHLEKCYQYV